MATEITPAELADLNDPTTVDDAWLAKVRIGFLDPCKVGDTRVHFALSRDGNHFRMTLGDGYYVNGVRVPKTRGAVRILCRVLGIELNEPTATAKVECE
jgi:hypothetical protein